MNLTQMTFASLLLGGLVLSLIGGGWTHQKLGGHPTDWASRPRTLLNIYAQQREESADKLAGRVLAIGLIVVGVSAVGLIVATILR